MGAGPFSVQTLGYLAYYDNDIFRTLRPYAVLPDGSVGTATARQYANGREIRATGVEFETRYRTEAFDAFIAYTLVTGTEGDTTGSGNPHADNFRFVPRHSLSGGLFAATAPFDASGTVRYVSATTGGLSRTVPAQVCVDLSVGYSMRLQSALIHHAISVHNLLNESLDVPEYVDRVLNELPGDTGRRFRYTLALDF